MRSKTPHLPVVNTQLLSMTMPHQHRIALLVQHDVLFNEHVVEVQCQNSGAVWVHGIPWPGALTDALAHAHDIASLIHSTPSDVNHALHRWADPFGPPPASRLTRARRRARRLLGR